MNTRWRRVGSTVPPTFATASLDIIYARYVEKGDEERGKNERVRSLPRTNEYITMKESKVTRFAVT